MKGTIGLLNENYEVAEELRIVQVSDGCEYLSDRMKALVFDAGYSVKDVDDGEWITVVDGRVIGVGNFHPHTIALTEQTEPTDDELTFAQKSDLFQQAKELAVNIYEEMGWSIEESVDGAITDTVDDRSYHSTFDGDREVAQSFLDRMSKEIRVHLVKEVKE